MLLIKLLLSHLLGDFFTQPNSWIKHKEKYKLKSSRLYLHVLIHMILLSIILWDITLWPIILTISITHLIIDSLKLTIQSETNKRWMFFIDQIFHLTIILVMYLMYSNTEFNVQEYLTPYVLLMVVCILFLTLPTSIIMQTIFTKWDISALTADNESLKDAGKYIGILERVLVFTFIMVGHWEAVGFLITAKSVFRFGDLKESKHRKLTEYILIGTLISFGIAVLTAIVANYFS